MFVSAQTMRLAEFRVTAAKSTSVSLEVRVMNPIVKTTLVVAFAVSAFLLFGFSGGASPWTEASSAAADSARSDAIPWVWLPGLLVVVSAVALRWAIARRR